MRCFAILLAAGCLYGEPNSFTIAGIRVTPERWDKEANFAKLATYSRQAAGRGAKLVVTPEGFLEGYVANNRESPKGRSAAAPSATAGQNSIGTC
jgi:predicted amidohydrolase